jgi:hypothetical protein
MLHDASLLALCGLTLLSIDVAVSISGYERSIMETLRHYLLIRNSTLKHLIQKRIIKERRIYLHGIKERKPVFGELASPIY